jgi:hypothetical protein
MSDVGTPSPDMPPWRRALGARPDETVLRVIFGALVAVTITVLGFDLWERAEAAAVAPALLPGETPDIKPFLPSSRPNVAPPGEKSPGRAPRAELQQPMLIELVSGGRLEATGAITPGTAERFKEEIEKRGDYVKMVVLNSPGGSVRDALAMSKLIREKGLSTRVEANAHCASSCPLIFSGGVERVAEKGASVGVHQVMAVPMAAAPLTGMAENYVQAQKVSAECQRHLVDMGVDARVWIHAMETPPEEIFYFTDEELVELKLATSDKTVPQAAATKKR